MKKGKGAASQGPTPAIRQRPVDPGGVNRWEWPPEVNLLEGSWSRCHEAAFLEKGKISSSRCEPDQRGSSKNWRVRGRNPEESRGDPLLGKNAPANKRVRLSEPEGLQSHLTYKKRGLYEFHLRPGAPKGKKNAYTGAAARRS